MSSLRAYFAHVRKAGDVFNVLVLLLTLVGQVPNRWCKFLQPACSADPARLETQRPFRRLHYSTRPSRRG